MYTSTRLYSQVTSLPTDIYRVSRLLGHLKSFLSSWSYLESSISESSISKSSSANYILEEEEETQLEDS